MARSYQDLLAKAREQVPEVQVADLAARRAAGDGPAGRSTSASSPSGTRGTSPGRSTSRAATSRAASPASRRPGPGDRPELRLGQPVAARGHARCRRWASTNVLEPRRRVHRAGSRAASTGRRAAARSPRSSARATAATSLIPEIGEAGPARAARLEGAPDRRRRPRLPGGLLPGRRRRGHDRPGGRRRGRRQQPAAPDHPHHRPRRACSRASRPDRDRGAQPGRRRSTSTRSGWTRRTSST